MPGRNDPCPCGSGKKYKHCCQREDAARASAERRLGFAQGGAAAPGAFRLPPGASLPDPWEVAIVPLMMAIGDDPDARPVAVLVVSDALVAHADILVRPPVEPNEWSPVVERAILDVIEQSGVSPRRVRVRHPELAAHLAPRLAERGIDVRAARELPGADEAASALIERFSGPSAGFPGVSHPEKWAGWGLPPDDIRALFAAAAAYYRAAPWRFVQDDQVMEVQVPGGGAWAVTILGHGKLTFGISLFVNPDDVDALLRSPSPDQVSVPEVMIGLSFDPKDDLPPATRREIREAGWEIAGPAAYPQLLMLNTLGGGVTRRQIADLTAVIDAVPGFVAEHAQVWANDAMPVEPIIWRHETSGVEIEYQRRSDVRIDSLWEPPATLAPAGPEGPGARVGALIAVSSWDSGEALVENMLEQFANWLKSAAPRPLSPAAARRHAVAVEPFLHCLVFYSGIVPQAVTEYDLRDFLYRWYPMKVIDSDTATRSLPGSLKRFFGFLASVEGVQCPWAAAILRDRDTFLDRRETRPMGLMSDEPVRAWVSDLKYDLDARLLLPSADHALGVPWNELMGEVEATLFDQLHRLWLAWRDDAVRSGLTDREQALAVLLERQREWSHTPNSVAGGKTPARAVAREQSRMR